MIWSRRRTIGNGKMYTAIDVGTTKVCTLIGLLEDDEYFRIIGVGIGRSQGMRKAVVIDLNQVGDSVKDSVREAEISSGTHISSAYIGITGSHVSSFNTSSAISIPQDQPVASKDLQRLMQHAWEMRMSTERQLLHAVPSLYKLDDQTEVKNPLGLHSSRLDSQVHMVTAATHAVNNLVKSVRRAGVAPEDIILEPLASGEAVLRPAEKDVGIVVVDIGGGTTDIAVFKNNSVWHTAAIPVAGYQVTRDLAFGLGVSYETAEALKLKYASMEAGDNGRPAPDTVLELEDNGTIPYKEFREILTARVEEMLELVKVELATEDLRQMAPAGLVLTGGTSKLPGITAVAQRVFGLPCRVGVPRNISGLVHMLHDPAFATSVGLLYWGAKYSHQELRRVRHPSPLTRMWLSVRRRSRFWRWLSRG
jgi:cell division protein FtsA